MHLISVSLSLSLLALAAPPSAPAKTPRPAARKAGGFSSLRSRYVATFFRRFPVVATYLGASGLDPALSKLDERLRDYSPPALRAERQEWEALQGELKRVNRAALSDADRVDAEAMAAQLAFLIRNLDGKVHERALDVYAEEPLRAMEWSLQGMTPRENGKAGTAAEWRSLASRAGAVPAYLRVALTNLRRGATSDSLPDRRMIRAGVESAGSTAAYFQKDFPSRVAELLPAGEAESGKQVAAESAAAAKAFLELKQGLVTLYDQPDGTSLKREMDRDRFAIGEEAYAWALKNDLRVDRTPRELHAYGKRMVLATLESMRGLARQIAAARGWDDNALHAVIARLSDDVPKTDAEMLSWYRDACQRLVEYARKTGLFEVPDTYRLDVVYTPPPLRATLDAAYYPAPAFKKTGVGQFYLTPTGDDPVGLRAHARAAVASLAAHEGFPGHDWYYKVLTAKAATISPVRWLTPGGVEDSASMWMDSMSSEGWALYTEQLVGEARPGFPDGFYTPEERLFQLQNQLLRDARVVVDTGIHCGYMSFDDAVNYFAKNVYFVQGPVSTDEKTNPNAAERAGVDYARRDIFRYSKWPTQAITYHLGKAAILALREDVRKIEGDAFDERRFHDELLAQGSVPPGMFSEILLKAARGRAAAAPAKEQP